MKMDVVNEMSTGRKAAYTVKEFCRMFSIGRSTFYNEVSAGRLSTRKIGSRTLILADDVASWADALRSGSAS
jgi:excisionase family DNA binding protein